MIYLIGSKAFNYWFGENREKDFDIVTDEQIDSNPSLKIDVCPNDLPLFTVCERYNSGETLDTPIGPATIVSPVGLMLIKRSHLHRPIGFSKHIRDYHFLKQRFEPDSEYDTLLETLTAKTKEKYGDKTPKLNKSKQEFFDDYVTKIYDHDDIHRWTCYYDEPIYERLKSNKTTVWCEKSKWDELSHDDKIKCVREEAFVIAIERYLLVKEKYPERFAFANAVDRICTTLCSGWFRDFAIENWPEIMEHNYNFWEKFNEKRSDYNY